MKNTLKGYSIKQDGNTFVITKIAPYDNANYYWAIAKTDIDGFVVNILREIGHRQEIVKRTCTDTIEDIAEELTMANSAVPANICHN